MKAPDKIYLREFEDALSQVWSGIKPTEETIIASHEYIRKDAILEWLEQNRNQSQMWFDRYHEKEDLSAKQVWEEVISKLNSI